ncbi:MAG TPA: 1,4-alpha-glucan branching protein domain-containing protein [Solirubrobacteraceae bacterium]|jgi:1,4-alpha-glucan branching enzyme|nr:1,4-alpha-glucan branching protein domain-containing protein [Solirubrobacteraceae bacterium]
MRRSSGAGELAIVLHTHMPYVEGFGTWPFGEEWLWEAISGSYLPLLDLLDEGVPLTLSLTPVLCDQLEAAGVGGRFEAFVDDVRRRTHAEDIAGLRENGFAVLARELQRSWDEYEHVLRRFRERGGDLLGELGRHAQWTSSATHAVLPLLATDAGVRAQVQTGVDSHRARFGQGWQGGFWLPECAHAPHLEPLLEEAGVRATCLELTNRFGLGAREHLRPLVGESGVVLVPIDRAIIALVWSDAGYPAHGSYRDYHHHTIHHHNPWANDGSPYDHQLALGLAREHAVEFVATVIERLRRANEPPSVGAGLGTALEGPLPGGGLAVCALDTELLGHWWYEGVEWLRAVVDECAKQGLSLVRLDEAQALCDPAPLDDAEWEPSTWGKQGDLSTWSGSDVADMAFVTRAAELQTLACGDRAGAAALRELLALQASDWAFMVSRGLAGPYARERFANHSAEFEQALASGPEADLSALRNLAAHADPLALLAP